MAGHRMATIVAGVVAVLVGAVAAFFTAGPGLFSDGSGAERVFVLGLSVAVFAVLGLVAGAALPGSFRTLGLCLAVPVALVAALFGRENPLLAVGFVVGDVAAALFGSWAGSALRGRIGGR